VHTALDAVAEPLAERASKAAVAYKERWHHILAERARNGTTGREPVPHPDEVIIDLQTGEVRIEGPVLQEQKEARDYLHARRRELEEDLREIEEELASDPNNPQLRKMQKVLTRIVNWVRQDALKRNLRKATRQRCRRHLTKALICRFPKTSRSDLLSRALAAGLVSALNIVQMIVHGVPRLLWIMRLDCREDLLMMP
jgi:hypothetical protein